MASLPYSEIEDCKKRLQEFLVKKVVDKISGRDCSDIIGSPFRSLYAGVLKPRLTDAAEGEGTLEKHQSSSIGIDCRIRQSRADEAITIVINARWCCYYPVFPTWYSTQMENAFLNSTDSDCQISEIRLPVTFRRKEVIGKPVIIEVHGNETTIHVTKFDEEMASAKGDIDLDPDRWCHLGDPIKQNRTLSPSAPIVDESSFRREIDKTKGKGRPHELPRWSVSLQSEISRDIADPTVHRLKILLSNETIAFDEAVKDRRLDERALLDAQVEVEINKGVVVPFEFQLAERDYRAKPKMIAKGINCSVRKSSSQESLITDTLPLYEQPLLRTKGDSAVKFESLDVDLPTTVIEDIVRSMEDYSSRWLEYLDGAGKEELSEDESKRCKDDRRRFEIEVQSLRLGVECLVRNRLLNRAFRLMNRVFARLGQKSGGKIEAWRSFQLCFIVTQMPSLLVRELNGDYDEEFADAVKRSYEKASVLWFPTGGGKTEAYLGLIATALIFDRLRGKTRGINTWMRFPLRMLSLQQMQRLGKVIAELNVMRSEEHDVSGGDPFSVGYYVGGTVTPNAISEKDMEDLEKRKEHLRRILILRKCPYCDAPAEIAVDRKHWRILHVCTSESCFSNTSESLGALKGSLPLFIVDQEIYRFLPSVLVGTVDKLAIAAFNIGFSHLLYGSVQRCPEHGYASYDECLEVYAAGCKNAKKKSLESLAPVKDPGPSLLLQDELHLLRADLGVFNGHYEGFIQYVGKLVSLPPKVLAATATIESYEHHAFHLYLKHADRFPVPSWKKGESFYATSLPHQVRRTYVGILCHTSAVDDAASRVIFLYQHELKILKENLTTARVALGAKNLTDGEVEDLLRLYDLSLAYVNRKTTGSTLLHKLELSNSSLTYEGLPELKCDLLTGDRTPDDIGATLERIESEKRDTGEPRLDVVAATSLISHGVDIDRINMMTICGMPSHYAEYVQSSSRAARSHPGIVFSCFLSKDVRELSQYEMFLPMHENLDALIEPVAVNRFASFGPSKTVPGLLSALLLNGLGPRLYGKGIARPLMHLPTVKVALGLASAGSSGTKHCIEIEELRRALREIIGVNQDWIGVSKKELTNVDERISAVLDDLIARIGRTQERRLPEALNPITSFRDVDQGLEFGSLESASLVTRLSGR